MDKTSVKLTVFFENPFWAGVFERVSEGKLSVCKVTFGAEPSDQEVWDFILKHYGKLTFSPAVQAEAKRSADNPKRRQREARKQVRSSGIGTKSQQALAMQREEMNAAHRQVRKQQKEAGRQRQLELKRQKRKEKHKGH